MGKAQCRPLKRLGGSLYCQRDKPVYHQGGIYGGGDCQQILRKDHQQSKTWLGKGGTVRQMPLLPKCPNCWGRTGNGFLKRARVTTRNTIAFSLKMGASSCPRQSLGPASERNKAETSREPPATPACRIFKKKTEQKDFSSPNHMERKAREH